MNHENAQKQRDFKRKRYKEKPEIKIDYQKKKEISRKFSNAERYSKEALKKPLKLK